ncbi:hypothetical protein SDC9_151973 [bioreactor metagenome]|uniref:Uncharacterized protein n=1 Tax=bioreactor metagenome TaxID=1076179 RepID=A0A645ERT0_9ZZZZ
MKKTLAMMLAIALVMALSTTALALEIPDSKITITAQPVDYRSAISGYAQPVNKSYVANESYAALVSIEIPTYMNTSGLSIEVTPKGCTVEDVSALALATGDYLLTGMVLTPGATLKVTIKDTARDTANTTAELYDALYNDRTVSATATLGITSTATDAIPTIPKTGAPVQIGGAALCLFLAAGLMWRRKHA